MLGTIQFGGDGIVMEELIATTKSKVIGPSVVCALPLAAGTNHGGNFFHYLEINSYWSKLSASTFLMIYGDGR